MLFLNALVKFSCTFLQSPVFLTQTKKRASGFFHVSCRIFVCTFCSWRSHAQLIIFKSTSMRGIIAPDHRLFLRFQYILLAETGKNFNSWVVWPNHQATSSLLKAPIQTSEKITPLAQYFWENTINFVIFSHRTVTPPLACKSLASLDIVFQISIKQLARPAEREGLALLIEDLRVDRPLPPPLWRDSYDVAENTAGVSGQGGACQ